MIKKSTYYSRLALLLSAIVFSINTAKAEQESTLNIYTVNYPLSYFAKSIAGQHAKVTLPMPADIDPAFWSPKAEDIAKLQQADLILLNGASYAKWLPKVSLPLSKLVNTSSQFRDAYITLEENLKHNHGTGGEHSHAGTAFTTWLDFSLAEKHAASVLNAISNKNPSKKEFFAKNYHYLQASLQSIDSELTEISKLLKDKALLGSHPVYQYLKKHYQLNLKSVHWEPEEMPSDEQWARLQQILEKHPTQWMLWEGEPIAATVAKLETLGIKSIVFSPCGNQPENGDFLSVMAENIKQLKIITNTATPPAN